MKRSLMLILLIVFSVTTIGCYSVFNNRIEGDGNITTKSFDVSKFTAIDASHSFIIDVIVGETQSVKVRTDENLLKYVEVAVHHNTLYLDRKSNLYLDGDINVIISVESLNSVDLSGACKIDIENISSHNFTVDVSGASKGFFSGTVENLILDLSGATKINAVELIAQNVTIDMSGASKLDVYCENSLTVDASGASKINVFGDPKRVKTDFSGASSVNFK